MVSGSVVDGNADTGTCLRGAGSYAKKRQADTAKQFNLRVDRHGNAGSEPRLEPFSPLIGPISRTCMRLSYSLKTTAKGLKDCLVNADEVKRLRKRLGYTQVELAAVLGVHKLTVSAWEMGRRNISRPTEIALNSLPKNPRNKHRRIR